MKLIEWIKNTASLERIGYAFIDTVDGRGVYYWRDRDGVVWLKNSKWALFSVRSSMVDDLEEKQRLS